MVAFVAEEVVVEEAAVQACHLAFASEVAEGLRMEVVLGVAAQVVVVAAVLVAVALAVVEAEVGQQFEVHQDHLAAVGDVAVEAAWVADQAAAVVQVAAAVVLGPVVGAGLVVRVDLEVDC